MNRVRSLFTVAKCFAANGVQNDDSPVWIAGTFMMLLDLLEEALDEAMALIVKEAKLSAQAEAKPADDRPAA